jgi:signal transduction histidine kinase
MTEFKNIAIRKKLIIIQVATAFIAVLMCCGIFVFNNVKVFTYSSIATKNSIAEIIGMNAAPALEFMDHDAANKMLMELNSNPSILNAIILDKSGKEFARYNKPGEEKFLLSPNTTNEAQTQNNFDRKFTVSYKIFDKEFLGTVMLHAEISGFRDIILSYIKIAFTILLASLIAAFVISTFLQQSITSRLLSLVTRTREVTETGNYSIRVSTEGTDEIGALSVAFNNMLSQIEAQNAEIMSFNQNLEQKVRDRTRQLEAANQELEAFSYSVSHDLRAPLRAVDGFTGMLAEDYDNVLDDKGKRLLEQVRKNGVKMGHLIDDLLEFSRLGRKEISKSEVDMDELVAGVISEMDKSYPHKAQIKVNPMGRLLADPALITQVITNLLSNAIKYSSKKEHPFIEIKMTAENKEFIYSVSDNGAGFSMQYASKLFGVFQRLHRDEEFEGTGVGLAIVQRIITKHGGRVWAEGKEGEGATFYFSLPAEE